MSLASQSSFQFTTPEIEVERAVSELRYGRPVLVCEQFRKYAFIALDAVTPSIYDQFAAVTNNRHSLLLTAPRATRLGIAGEKDILVPLRDVSFDQASRWSYVLGASTPAEWSQADDLAASTAELARIALLLPATVIADVSEVASRFSGCCEISASRLKGADVARQHFEKIVSTKVPLKDLGNAQFAVFRGGLAQKDQVAIIVGEPDFSRTVPIRIHSSCLTGDLCGSLKCDCGDQLRNGLALLKQAGGGVLLYLDQEGRGTGIGAKMRAYGYQHQGLDTIDADAELGLTEDHRRYEAAVALLRMLNISKVAVYTNNPTKIAALRKGGIEVDARSPVTGTVTVENQNYLRTKTLRAGHMMDMSTLVAAE
ncbi:GTP cyclohydrolase II RibA [Agrobacterium larrymoorei]|uniref:GTP cyclohydrolase II RibA n=1 Tax=Agrobacterium larrymoorei TaxID=160699 RepID=UPI00157270CD|nr:GTP cyclohydrolase II RibA [Agrobacterium larrymoorei]NTJ43920.1 GTP cyclohydrolase II RibA [Agrobacterium larrymoorei]